MSGAATLGIAYGPQRYATMADWEKVASSPTLWPVEGTITGAFEETKDAVMKALEDALTSGTRH